MGSKALLVPAECRHPAEPECTAALWLWTTLAPTLLIVGTCGNLLSIVVLARKRLRVHSTSIFLLCLAVSDLTFLYCSVARQFFLRVVGVDIKDTSFIICRTHAWLTIVSAGYCAWLLVLVTMERLIMIAFPLSTRNKITKQKAVCMSLILLVCVVVVTFHHLFNFEITDMKIEDVEGIHNGTTQILGSLETAAMCTKTNVLGRGAVSLVNLVVFNILPVTIVFIGNVGIALKLASQSRHRSRRVQPETAQPQPVSQFDKKRVAATKMLMLVCFFGLITTIPKSVFTAIIASNFARVNDGKVEARLQLLHAAFCCLLYSNFSINFFIYVSRGTMFRNELINLVKAIRTKLVGE